MPTLLDSRVSAWENAAAGGLASREWLAAMGKRLNNTPTQGFVIGVKKHAAVLHLPLFGSPQAPMPSSLPARVEPRPAPRERCSGRRGQFSKTQVAKLQSQVRKSQSVWNSKCPVEAQNSQGLRLPFIIEHFIADCRCMKGVTHTHTHLDTWTHVCA